MEHKNGYDGAHDIHVTAYDRLMRAWEDTKEHARDFSNYALLYDSTPEGDLFRDLAEKQGRCAADLLDRLREIRSHDPQN